MTRTHGVTIAASVVVHAVLAGLVSWGALRSLSAGAASSLPAETPGPQRTAEPAAAFQLPTVGEGILVEDERFDPTGDPPRINGGEEAPRLDTGSPGRGGDVHARTAALNLADRDDHMRLSPDLVSRLDRDQLQRLRVANERRSWEDERATTHPTELSLVVTGPGTLLERRPAAPSDPSRGALESPAPEVRGGAVGAASTVHDDGAVHRGGALLGMIAGAPGEGVLQGRPGLDHRGAAPIGSARPDVTQGAVSVPALDSARPKDNVDSEQEVATTIRSLVHASAAGGLAGDGQGGDGAGGEAGAGGASGAGSHARPLGAGDGDVFDYNTSDPRLVPYFRELHARIDPLWANAFPKSALLDLKQGTVILEFTIASDGAVAVTWPPVRPSGIDEFDANCATAVRRAGRLPPIPRELGMRSIRVRAPFTLNNPVIR
ncbi:MAG TPA: energy transducer TonB [Polyangiaceae bacterium]